MGSSFGGYSGNFPTSYSNRAFYPSSSLNRFAYSSPVTTYPYGGVGTVGASGFGGYDNGLNGPNNYNGLNGLNGFAGGYQQQGFY